MRAAILWSVLLVACSAPDRGGAPSTSAPVAVTSNPLSVARRPFALLGQGPSFVREDRGFAVRFHRTMSATAPIAANGVQRLVARTSELDLTPLDVRDVKGTTDGSTVTYTDVASETDMILATTPTEFEEVRVLRGPSAPSILRWKVAHTGSIPTVRVRENRVEALDADGVVTLGTAPIVAIDARGERLPIAIGLEGDVLTVSVDTTGASYPIVVDPAWSTAASMARARNGPAYAMQSDGKLFVVGGGDTAGAVTATEEYNPTTNAWNNAENKPGAGYGNVAVSLGTSIVVTGLGTDGRSVAHWFTGTKAYMLGLPQSTVGHNGAPAVALSTSQVLVFGNGGGGSTAEIYQYSGGTFTWLAAGNFPYPRRGISGAILPDGRPIALGGELDTSGSIFPSYSMTTTTVVYNTSTKTWSAGPNLNLAREEPEITKLASGALLITGGRDKATNKRVATAELYDPATKTFKTTGALATARQFHTATLLPNGKVLIAGGYGDAAGALNSAELYDPATGTFSSAGTLLAARASHGAVLLPGGKVFLFGGHNGSVPLSSTEIFEQANLAAACTAGYECSSGNCVDAHCCDSASCASDQTCVSGKCAKKGATPCAMGTECSSGNCVDGYCCDSACTGQCEACNVSGKEGTCSPSTGSPVGSRPMCTGAIVGGECGSQCDGSERTKCNFPGTAKACGSRGCLDGVESVVGVCDGAGRCSATPRSCSGYACAGETCGTSCATDTECLSTHRCIDSKCAPRGATCSPDNSRVVEADGKTTSCAPFACKAGACANNCAASTDCVVGAICDGTGKCVAPPSESGAGDEGGCNVGHASDGSWFALLIAAALVSARRRQSLGK